MAFLFYKRGLETSSFDRSGSPVRFDLHSFLLNFTLVCYKYVTENPACLREKIMATVSAKIYEHHKKADGTYNVKICVYHKGNRKYIDTTHYVVKKQLTKDFKTKDPFIADIVEQQLRKYRNTISDSAVHNYMRDLRTLFNAARNRYNEEDIGIFRIKHYPFKKYKVGTPPPRGKDRHNTIEEVLAIKGCVTKPGSRAELAKELYMLSFYLCGTNAVDFYKFGPQNIKGDRLEYKRSKTTDRRKDEAFISIKIVDEAKPLLEKYIGKLAKRYSTIGNLNKALSKGMAEICRLTGLSEVTFYWARHTFGNTARNECRMSKDDIALALNHVDEGNRTTDIYIAKDWKIVDDVQRKVIALLRKVEVRAMKKTQKINRADGIAA